MHSAHAAGNMVAMDANVIQRQARNAVRKGSILDIDYAAALCRVMVSDADDGIGHLETMDSAAFDRGRRDARLVAAEQTRTGHMLCPMGDLAQGGALRGFYHDDAPSPSTSPDTPAHLYPDGALVEYDHTAHRSPPSCAAGATAMIVAPGAANASPHAPALFTAVSASASAGGINHRHGRAHAKQFPGDV